MNKIGDHDLEYKTKTIVGLFIIAVLLFVCLGGGIINKNMPTVTIAVEDTSIFQGEDMPDLTVYAVCDKKVEDFVLDEVENYQLKDLLNDLNQGNGYQLRYSVDTEKEGEYSLQILLDDSLKEKLAYDWSGKLKYQVEEGTLKVKNALGEWEGGKFKKRDGSYATSEFINLNDDTYYLDAEGNRVTGEQTINGAVYYFGKDGKFDNEKNKINPAKPMIALTFDDGPGQYTDALLEALEKYDSRATFFMLGENISKYPEAIERMKEIGCEIGNHTMNHKRLTDLSVEDMNAQVEGTNDALKSLIGERADVVRPPYGAVNSTVRGTVQYPLIMWSVDTTDWQRKNAESIKNYTLETVQDGDIVLMHDIHEFTVQAVIDMIPELVDRGYQLVTVQEMAQARGIQMENGVKYFSF